jgi:hypothetical protein
MDLYGFVGYIIGIYRCVGRCESSLDSLKFRSFPSWHQPAPSEDGLQEYPAFFRGSPFEASGLSWVSEGSSRVRRRQGLRILSRSSNGALHMQ